MVGEVLCNRAMGCNGQAAAHLIGLIVRADDDVPGRRRRCRRRMSERTERRLKGEAKINRRAANHRRHITDEVLK